MLRSFYGLRNGLISGNMEILAATAKGKKHTENEDHHFVRIVGQGRLLFGVADGIGSSDFGGSVARWLVETYLAQAEIGSSKNFFSEVGRLLVRARAEFSAEFEDFQEFLRSGCTLALVAIADSQAECFWLGDSSVFRWHPTKGDAEKLTPPHVNSRGELTKWFDGTHEFDFSNVNLKLESGDSLMVITDGVCLNSAITVWNDKKNLVQESVNEIVNRSTHDMGSDDATLIWYRH